MGRRVPIAQGFRGCILKAWEEDLIKIQTLHNFCPVPTSVFRPNPNCYEFSDPRPHARRPQGERGDDPAGGESWARARSFFIWVGRALRRHRQARIALPQGRFLNRRYADIKVRGGEAAQKNFERSGRGSRNASTRSSPWPGNKRSGSASKSARFSRSFPTRRNFRSARRLSAGGGRLLARFRPFRAQGILGWHSHAETLRLRAPRLIGCHIHDCRRPQEDHLPLGHGEIAF
jgi:hypothetical protein